MGYFDGLTDASFKKDDQGRTLFYPWGIFGSGILLESEDKAKEIRGFLKTYYLVIFAVLLPILWVQRSFGIMTSVAVSGAILAVLLVWFYGKIKKLTRGLPKSAVKLKASESYKNSAKSHSLGTLIFLEIVAILSIPLAYWVLPLAKAEGGFVYGSIWVWLGMMGLSSLVIGYMIIVKIKARAR